MTVTVRPITAADEAAFRNRWDKYNVFYKRTVPEDVTAFTIKRMLDPNVPLYGAVALSDNNVVGFVTYLPHIYTATNEDIVYLHDLYVDDDVRNGGIGRALIEHVYKHSKELGCESVYWHTQHFNHRAQLLYTKVANKTDFVQYKHVL